MKRNFMWLASLVAIALIGFTACDNEKNGGKTPEADGYGYASFTIALPNASLKAGVDGITAGNTYEGTKAEGIVSSVLVGIYNGAECIERIILDVKKLATDHTIGGDDVATTPSATANTFTTKAKKIAKVDGATYKMVVFLNPTAAVNGIVVKGRQLADLERAAAYSEADLVSSTKGIMMSNAKGLIEFAANNLHSTADAAQTATDKPTVAVERAVAKVFVNDNVATPSDLLNGATATMQGWNLDVTNKKMFYVRQMDKDKDGVDETANTSRFDSYAKDPNMIWTSGTAPLVLPADDFDYKENTVLAPVDLWTAGFSDDNLGKYVSENTMGATSQYRPVTTHVIFAIKIKPPGTKFDTVLSYVTYANTPYTISEFTEKIDKVTQFTLEGKTDVEIDAVLAMASGFAAEVNRYSGGADALKAALEDGKPAFASGNIRFYPDMVNYYSMPIRHFDDTQAPDDMQYGRYGIVRNNIYKLSVTALKNFGEPVVPEIEDEPDDKKVGYIAMDVTIHPWLVRESGYEL